MRSKHLLPIRHFIRRVIENFVIGFVIIIISLLLGVLGYRYIEGMSWVDAYENAAMILAGMGPAEPIHTTGGKIFAGSYALFSGIVFLIVIAVILSPLVHRIVHKFIISEGKEKQ